MTTGNILADVEEALLDLLGTLAQEPASLLTGVESFDIFDDRTLATAIQKTQARQPAGFLSQPSVVLDKEDTRLPLLSVEFLFGAVVTGRRRLADRRTEVSRGTYAIWQAAYAALHGQVITLPAGLVHPARTQPIEVTAAQFASDAGFSIMTMGIRVGLRAERISTDPR